MKLTDTQAVILSAASQRSGRQILPLPERLKGGAAKKVVTGLLSRGLIAEVEAGRDDPVWREADGKRLMVVATDAALTALGVEPDSAPEGAPLAQGPQPAADHAETPEAAQRGHTAPDAPRTRSGTKQARLIEMLRTPVSARSRMVSEAQTTPKPSRSPGASALDEPEFAKDRKMPPTKQTVSMIGIATIQSTM